MITVVEHDPAWAGQFEALRSGYQEPLTSVPVVAIEHVGSTSMPALAAKPVIDIDIVVAEDVQRLPRTNTYVVIDGCLALRNHLAISDLLRRDDDLRHEYAAIKRSIASKVDDIEQYAEQQSAFPVSGPRTRRSDRGGTPGDRRRQRRRTELSNLDGLATPSQCVRFVNPFRSSKCRTCPVR